MANGHGFDSYGFMPNFGGPREFSFANTWFSLTGFIGTFEEVYVLKSHWYVDYYFSRLHF